MSKFFKKHCLYFIITGIIAVTLIVLNIVPSNYEVLVPGDTSKISKVFVFDDEVISKKDVGVYSVSVLDYSRASVMNLLFAKMNKYSLIYENSEYEDTSSTYVHSSGTVQKQVSINNAIISAYRKAGELDSSISIDYEFKGYIIHSLYGDASKYFQVGDIVTGFEDTKLSESLSLSKAIGTLEMNKAYHVTVIRNGEEVEVEAYPFEYVTSTSKTVMLGISMYADYEYDSDSINPTFTINYPSSTGPSAGLAMSLYLYDKLTGLNLTKDLKVVTTGTIDVNGNVGSIGGVEAKIVAAAALGADYFFVPTANFDDAYAVYQTLNTSMHLINVDSLDDCINVLKNR